MESLPVELHGHDRISMKLGKFLKGRQCADKKTMSTTVIENNVYYSDKTDKVDN